MANNLTTSQAEAIAVSGAIIAITGFMSELTSKTYKLSRPFPVLEDRARLTGLGADPGVIAAIIGGVGGLLKGILGLFGAKQQRKAAEEAARAAETAAKYQYQAAEKLSNTVKSAALLIMLGLILYALLKPKK
jgi:hypothetical protein